MTTKKTPTSLDHYFTLLLGEGRAASPTELVSRGADCVTTADVTALRPLLGQLKEKSVPLSPGSRLRHRVEMLATYFEETPDLANTSAQRETAFTLYYFLKGYDLIPDSIPEIGLLDDALLVETTFNRNLHELRAHWAAQGRPWPEEN